MYFSCRYRPFLVCLLFIVRALPVLAANDPPQGKARVDRYGDPLPARAKARIGTLRFRHGGPIHGVAFSADGKRIASADESNTVHLWDAATGRETAAWPVPQGQTAFAAKGNLLACSSLDGLTYLWDSAAGKPIHRLGKVSDNQGCIAFSHDGKCLAARAGEMLRLYNTASGKEVLSLKGSFRYVDHILFTADDKQVLGCCDDGSIRMWDVAKRKEIRCFQAGHDNVLSLALTPDGTRLISAGTNPLILVRHLKTGQEIRRTRSSDSGDEDMLAVLACSPDGKHLVSSGCRKLLVWNLETGARIHQIATQSNYASSAFSPDGKILAYGSDRTIRLWNVAAGKEVPHDKEPFEPISSVFFSADGKFLTFAAGNRVHVRDLSSGREVSCFTASETEIYFLHHSLDGCLLASHSEGAMCWWKFLHDGKEGRWIKRNTVRNPNLFGNYALSADLRTLVSWRGHPVSMDTTVRVQDMRTEEEIAKFARAPGYLPHGALSCDGTVVAFGYPDGWVRIYGIPSGRLRGQFHEAKVEFNRVAFGSADRVLVASAKAGQVRVWERATERLRNSFRVPKSGKMGFKVSPDGRLAVFWSEFGRPAVWRLDDGKELACLDGHRGSIRDACFAADGQTVATASEDTTVLLWDIADLVKASRPTPRRLTAKEMEQLWSVLTESDAAAAYRAMTTLEAAGDQTISFLRERLHPVPAIAPERLARLLADLDSDEFVKREKATRQLEMIGDVVEPALRKTLKDGPSLEARRRIEQILENRYPPRWSAAALRVLRAIEVLERIGTAEATRILTELAEGAPSARLTREAKASRDRLDARRVSPR